MSSLLREFSGAAISFILPNSRALLKKTLSVNTDEVAGTL